MSDSTNPRNRRNSSFTKKLAASLKPED
jgi:tRNA/tmRNA/rRNA uracil-C5-methylase (TrmA/RlmC/RlmD family)